jgi:membrane protease YdiL (CAAX protease family)
MRRDWLAVAFAMLFPTAMAWLYFVALAGTGDDPRQPNPAMRAAYTGGKAVQFGFPLAWVLLAERQRPRATAPTLRSLAPGFGFGLLVGAAILFLYHAVLRGSPLLHTIPPIARARLAAFGLSTPAEYLLFAGFLVVVHSLLEEYYWRWFVFGRLRELLPAGMAISLSSLAFMAHHVIILGVFLPDRFFSVVLPVSLCVALGGAVWAWLYLRTGSIYSPWLSHLLIDAAIMAVGYDLVFGALGGASLP